MMPNSGPASWRYTPPSTSSAVRSNKRKRAYTTPFSFNVDLSFRNTYLGFIDDDRYDPYPAAKRRAVSPSISTYLRGSPRISIPVAIPILVPNSSSLSLVITQTQSFAHPRTTPPVQQKHLLNSSTLIAAMGTLPHSAASHPSHPPPLLHQEPSTF